MEADTEIHSDTLGQAPEIQSYRGRSNKVHKGVKTTMGKPTETTDPREWELLDSRLSGGEPAHDSTRPSECELEICGLGSVWGH